MERTLGLRKLPRNVIVLGWVSFCTDLATEMLYPIMPLFLTSVLGASPAVLGVIDGVAEGISSGLRWIGGALSDRFRKRKPFVVAGYSISAISKPVMGIAKFAGGWPMFFFGRCADRLNYAYTYSEFFNDRVDQEARVDLPSYGDIPSSSVTVGRNGRLARTNKR